MTYLMTQKMIDDLSTEEYSYYLAYGDQDDDSNDLLKLLEEFLKDFDAGNEAFVV